MSKKPRVLVIAKTVPLHDRASGDYRLYQLLDILARTCEVDYLSTWHTALHKYKEKPLDYLVRDGSFSTRHLTFLDEKYFSDLKKIGVQPLNQVLPVPFTVRPTNDYDIRPFLKGKKYDVIWIEFFYLADQYIQEIRHYQPWAHVIVDSVDLHFRRLARQCAFLENEVKYLVTAKQEKKPLGKSHRQKLQDHRNYANHVKEHELKAYAKTDQVVMVSEDDLQEIKQQLPRLKTLYVPNIHKMPPVKTKIPGFHERNGAIFVGNFDHGPNTSSAIFIKHEIAPVLAKNFRSIPFYIVGSNPPYLVRNMAHFGPEAAHFEVTGYVPDTLSYLNKAKVSLAPILFGAGMNGKIGEALAAGVPVITTGLGANGMGLTHEKNCLVAETPEQFAYQLQRLHEDEALWNRLSASGRSFVEQSLGREQLEQSLTKEFHASFDLQEIRKRQKDKVKTSDFPLVALPKAKFKAVKKPEITVVLLTYNQWPYTELCLRSLAHAQKKSKLSVEYLVVDNASSDETRRELRKIPGIKLVENSKNLGFAAGNNVGIQSASGKDVVLLNNDTILAPGWLDRMHELTLKIPGVGIVGPSTNTEPGQALFGAKYNSIAEFFQYNECLERESTGSWELVSKISGLCMYLPRATLERVGQLDTDYGIGYFEDDDYCLRAQDAGLKLVWARDVYVHHFGSISFEHSTKSREKHLNRGMSQFIFKWGKRGLEHVAKEHRETLIRLRQPKGSAFQSQLRG